MVSFWRLLPYLAEICRKVERREKSRIAAHPRPFDYNVKKRKKNKARRQAIKRQRAA